MTPSSFCGATHRLYAAARRTGGGGSAFSHRRRHSSAYCSRRSGSARAACSARTRASGQAGRQRSDGLPRAMSPRVRSPARSRATSSRDQRRRATQHAQRAFRRRSKPDWPPRSRLTLERCSGTNNAIVLILPLRKVPRLLPACEQSRSWRWSAKDAVRLASRRSPRGRRLERPLADRGRSREAAFRLGEVGDAGCTDSPHSGRDDVRGDRTDGCAALGH